MLEEGANTPADVVWAQDSGALAASFAELPAEVNGSVIDVFRSDANKWVATSGRTRILVCSTERIQEDALPASILDLTDEACRNNGPQIDAIANGEVDFGLVNNYCLGRDTGPNPDFPVAQTPFAEGDIAAISCSRRAPASSRPWTTRTTRGPSQDFPLSPAAQQFIIPQRYEYPVVAGIIPQGTLESLEFGERGQPARRPEPDRRSRRHACAE